MESSSFRPPSYNSSFALCPTAATSFFLPSIYMVLFITALPGNAMSLWVFLRRISSISPTHVYLANLSISNLLMSIITPFLAAYFAKGSAWALRSILCQIVLHGITPVLHINIYISLLILAWVALSRFAVLIRNTHASRPSACISLLPHGFFSRLTQVSFANAVCATVWVVSVGGIVPVTVYYSVNEAMKSREVGDQGEGKCVDLCYSPAVELGGSVSSSLSIATITVFFVFYLLVLLSYVTLLRHIRRSRLNTEVSTSQSLLGRVFRNIVVIQIVLSVCLLPFHIYKPIFITVAHGQPDLLHYTGPDDCSCHPLNIYIEVKNFLLLLAVLRGSTDPVMYFLLDRTFRYQTLSLLRCNQGDSKRKPMVWSTTGSVNQKPEHLGEENVVSSTVESGFGRTS
ncbi:probable G-protein coupled receptor 82 [Kryptolebias marmoratus]|uniref:G protein-coupled receptor 82 n=1 Tax=Kryptolebias marmoratus TaxID=37003 RepID=A0A3Q3AEW1_KRYMA|nr:probable G-protein coupled receptor 82 [Kryptolebias marmoratus]